MASKRSDTVTDSKTVDTSDRLGLLKSRLALAKAWCDKPHKAWKEAIKEYEIDDISDTEEIRDKVRIPYIFRRVESDLPAIFDDQPELFFKGKDEAIKALENKIYEGYDWLWDIQSLDERIEDAGTYFDLLGIGMLESPWVTKTKKVTEMQPTPIPVTDEMGQPITDEMGQPMTEMGEMPVELEVPIIDNPKAEVPDPFKVYFSPETKFNAILDYEHCPYYFKETVMIKEEVKEKFGKDVDPDESMKFDDEDINTSTKNDASVEAHKDDLKRVTVYEYYGVLPEEEAKKIEGEPWSYDKDYHVFFTKSEELKAEECPYEIKPMHIVGNYGLANRFWKFGDAKVLRLLVKELEAYRSQILKHTRKMANPKPLIEATSDVDENAFNDPRVGRTVKYTGTAPTYLSPANLGQEVQVGVDMARTDLEKSSGSFDLASGGNQSQVKTPRGIQVFSEAADKNVRRKRKKIGRFIRQIILFQLRQLALNWTADDPMTKEVFGEDTDINQQVLDILKDDHLLAKLDVEIESLSLNRVQMKQDSLDLLDTALNSEAKFPGLVNLQEIWKDVLQNGFSKKDADRYLTSLQEIQQKGIEQFIQQIAQTNPELAGAIAQHINQPYAPELEAGTQEGEVPTGKPMEGGMPNEPTAQPQLQ
jgi:hypothetical protein